MNTKNFNANILISLIIIKANCFSVLAQCFFATDVCPNLFIKFYLYKNATLSNEPLLVDPLQLSAKDFEPLLPLKILLHGYNGNRDKTPNTELRPVLLQTQPVNIVSVDYGAIVQQPCYLPWAVTNARIIAKCLAQFINNLIEAKIYKNDDIHLIGFSLGAQIAGLTGNHVQNQLRHITGLDPAGVAFDTAPISEKLDSTDATFIDVIHTDLWFFGSKEDCGHVDFYPNYPKPFQVPPQLFIQNGCPLYMDEKCSHFRAAAYYAESITSSLGFWSYACENRAKFTTNQCSTYASYAKALMGYFTPESINGSYFLTTNPVAPFAKGSRDLIESIYT